VFERGDLVLIPFPFSDLSAVKKQPVLLLSRPDAYGDFIALAVTSRPQTDHGVALDRGFRRQCILSPFDAPSLPRFCRTN
jgi:hypothetical protein